MVEGLQLLFGETVLLGESDLVIPGFRIRIPSGRRPMNPTLWTIVFLRPLFENACGHTPCAFLHHLKYYKLQTEL